MNAGNFMASLSAFIGGYISSRVLLLSCEILLYRLDIAV